MKRALLVMLTGCLVLLPLAGSVQAQWGFFQNPLLGKSFQDFSLSDVSGDVQSLSGLRGNKSAIVFFWATWCPHCRTHLAKMNERASDILEKNIQIILVDLGEGAGQVQKYLDRNGIQFSSLLDKKGEVASLYGVQGIPTFILVDAQGVVKAVEHVLPEDYEQILLGK